MTSVNVTQSYKTIVVTEETGKTTTVTAPSQAVTVQTVGIGPQGPAGEQGIQGETGSQGPTGPQGQIGPQGIGEVLIDGSALSTIYVGTAERYSSTSSPVWRITRSIFNSVGVRTSRTQAANVTWTGRTTHTYA